MKPGLDEVDNIGHLTHPPDQNATNTTENHSDHNNTELIKIDRHTEVMNSDENSELIKIDQQNTEVIKSDQITELIKPSTNDKITAHPPPQSENCSKNKSFLFLKSLVHMKRKRLEKEKI